MVYPHFTLIQMKVLAINSIALKFRASFLKRVVMLRKSLSLANSVSTKCRSFYKCVPNSDFALRLLDFLEMSGIAPFGPMCSRITWAS